MQITGASVWTETRWWLGSLGAGLRRYPGQAAVALAVAWFASARASAFCLGALVIVIGALRVWARRAPASFTRWAYGPVRGHLWCWWMRRHWDDVSRACGLSVVEFPIGRFRRSEPIERVPQRRRIRLSWPRASVTVRMLIGQTVTDYEKAGEALRTAVGATQLRVEPVSVNEVALTFTIGDLLASPFEAAYPSALLTDDLAYASMGRCEDGNVWRLPVGPHTLVAGCSGAGKGSVFWSFAFGLAPAVSARRVQVHGIDLKGGMEVLMGADLFTMRATNAAEAVVVLETLVGWMRERTARYAGRVRSHEPSTAEPLHVVMIDELAALTAYCPERDLQRRAELAISLLCSQGRAPGFMVFACLQDPRKEVIPSRGLFTQMVGLRLKDVSETTMVLGESAVLSGAHCHRILRSMPGTGYVIPEDGGHPIRVRAGFASDEVIRRVAREFATPTRLPVDVSMLAVDEPPRARRPRQQGAA